jgi:tellurite resistance protein TerC
VFVKTVSQSRPGAVGPAWASETFSIDSKEKVPLSVLASYHPEWTSWAALSAVVIVMLAVDLFVFGRGDHEVTVRESGTWSVVWLAAAIGFGAVMWFAADSRAGSEYLAGYLLERSLSLDNLFVFAVLFSYFGVPKVTQPRVLSWGIMLALVLRLIFILIGAELLNRFHVTFYAFGVLLVYTAWKLARHQDVDIDPEQNPVVKQVRKRFPGVKPMVIVFIAVATTDLLFAVDSIPAIFAITTTPFIVFAANAFAMLGLRALYFLLVGVMDRFVYLSQGLAVILGIIGAKMLLIDVWHPPIWLSLVAIVVVLGATALLSMRADRRKAAAAA